MGVARHTLAAKTMPTAMARGLNPRVSAKNRPIGVSMATTAVLLMKFDRMAVMITIAPEDDERDSQPSPPQRPMMAFATSTPAPDPPILRKTPRIRPG